MSCLGPIYRGKRLLYFQSIDSVKQSWVDTADLRNESLWRDNMNAKPKAFNLFSGSRSSQSAAVAMDDDGVMFFGLIGSNEIACWNTRQRFESKNLISIAKVRFLRVKLQENRPVSLIKFYFIILSNCRAHRYVCKNINRQL